MNVVEKDIVINDPREDRVNLDVFKDDDDAPIDIGNLNSVDEDDLNLSTDDDDDNAPININIWPRKDDDIDPALQQSVDLQTTPRPPENIPEGDSDAIVRHHLKTLAEGKDIKETNDKGQNFISSVVTIQVNIDGVPTLIPSLWDGAIRSDEEAIKRAIASGIDWPKQPLEPFIEQGLTPEEANKAAHAALRAHDDEIHNEIVPVSPEVANEMLRERASVDDGGIAFSLKERNRQEEFAQLEEQAEQEGIDTTTQVIKYDTPEELDAAYKQIPKEFINNFWREHIKKNAPGAKWAIGADLSEFRPTKEQVVNAYDSMVTRASKDKSSTKAERGELSYGEKENKNLTAIREGLRDPNSKFRNLPLKPFIDQGMSPEEAREAAKISYAEAVKLHMDRGADSGFGTIARFSPTAMEATFEGLSWLTSFGGTVSEFNEGFIQLINKNPELRDVINAAAKKISGGRTLLTGDTVQDTKNAGRAMLGFLELWDQMVPVMGGQVVGLLSSTNRAMLRNVAAANKNLNKVLKARAKNSNLALLNSGRFKAASSEQAAKASDEAERVAAANMDIHNQLIRDFEETTGKNISDVDPSNPEKLILNYEKARDAGREASKELYRAEKVAAIRDKKKLEYLESGMSEAEATIAARDASEKLVAQTDKALDAGKFGDEAERLISPILNPDKMDRIVAIASDLKRSNPELWDDTFRTTKEGKRVSNKTVIDNLFDVTVSKDLTGEGSEELVALLNKYDFSFEDYVLTVVGSGSDAGKILEKLSRIRRARPANVRQAADDKARNAMDSSIRNFAMRLENVRRGGMVSQVATSARNLSSAVLRQPTEALGNVMDTALWTMQNKGVLKGVAQLASPENWKGSFRHFSLMYRNPLEAREYVDFILRRPELQEQYNLMFSNINEIQKLAGRGTYTSTTGKALDKAVGFLEDGVAILNTPNRLQEFLIRRTQFLGELERLTKREYGIDLITELNKGNLKGLLNNQSELIPKGARNFEELIADSVTKALDVTYAKVPDTRAGKAFASFVTRNGLTTVLPFPRFMANSLELLGQHVGGAAIPILKNIMKPGTRLTAKDRQRISRNLIGWAAIGAAYQYRTSDDAPEDYKMMNADDGNVIDTTPQFPIRQVLLLGEMAKQLAKGDYTEWMQRDGIWKEIAQTFLGTNIRTGTGAGFVDTITDLVSGVTGGRTDLIGSERAAKAVGRVLGNFLSTVFIPFSQVIDLQRTIGEGSSIPTAVGVALSGRTDISKDVAEDPSLDFWNTLSSNIMRPLKARGLFISPEEEAALPDRQSLGQPKDRQTRVGSNWKISLGLSMKERDSKEIEYLSTMGFNQWGEGSKSGVPSIKRFENSMLREQLPNIYAVAKAAETRFRKIYKNYAKESTKQNYTEDQFVRTKVAPIIRDQFTTYKEKINKLSRKGASLGGRSKEEMLNLMGQKGFRSLSVIQRRNAILRYTEYHNKLPDFLDTRTLLTLTKMGGGKLR